MPMSLKETSPVARKTHRCTACHVAIEPGTRYHRSTNIYDGRVYDWIECMSCADLLPEVYDWCGSPSEGVTGEDFWEWAHEERDRIEAIAYRLRNGCTCEQCRDAP